MVRPRSQPSAARSDPWRITTAVLDEVFPEAPGVSTYRLRLIDPDPHQPPALPGQFNMLYMPGLGEVAISLSGRAADNDQLLHTIRHVGNVTSAMAELSLGATLGVRGPFGSAWPIDQCLGRDVVLIGGGIGLAPLRPVIYELVRRRAEFGQVHLLVGARSPADLLFSDEYPQWQAGGIRVHSTVDRAETTWTGNIGVVTQLMERLPLPRPGNTALMTCGPEVMMLYAIQSALSRGISKQHLWLSLERNMNCAVGTCGHCQFGPHFICKDGPVLGFERIEKLLEVPDL